MKRLSGRRAFVKAASAAIIATRTVDLGAVHQRSPVGDTAEKSEVPDTLDLAERARLAINALTGAAECEKAFCETIQTSHLDHRPPYMNLRWNGPCLQKPVHALPLMRHMSGSRLNQDLDLKMLEAITRDIDSEGLWWLKTEGRPWRAETFKEDQCWPVAQGRLLVALLDWHEIDADPKWITLAQRLAGGLMKIALGNERHAWYYTAFLRSGWKEHPDPIRVTQKAGDTSQEPAVRPFFDIGLPLRGLSRWYALSGDKRALALAERLARFLMKPGMWGAPGPEMLVGSEHGHWQGHFHTRTMGMLGLLDYGLVRNDTHILRFVQEFYEYTRCFGIARMGFFPAVLRPLRTPKADDRAADGSQPQVSEGCGVADMVSLAINLSVAGVADYWEDVDRYVRNHLVEHQMVNRDLIREMSESGQPHRIDRRMETEERIIERNIGAFASGSDPTMLYGWWTMCCLGNCSLALYHVWNSILHSEGDTIQVNLLLNRASQWLDLESSLPYEGKVVLRIRTATRVLLRIPLGVDRRSVRCSVNSKDQVTQFLGNYLMVGELTGSDVVSVNFPIVESTETYRLPSYPDPYTLFCKGNTVVDISPRPTSPALAQMGSDDGKVFDVRLGYPIYQRTHYRQPHAPRKWTTRRAGVA